VRVGLPAGLEPREERLRDLEKNGSAARLETRPREVTVYLRGLKPGEKRTLTLELVAALPGTFEGPATSAYLYYTDDLKTWAAPLKVRVDPR
ncbi:MAG: alpha-2-macroglobulin family protein, partial [Planctomycetota bacterium]